MTSQEASVRKLIVQVEMAKLKCQYLNRIANTANRLRSDSAESEEDAIEANYNADVANKELELAELDLEEAKGKCNPDQVRQWQDTGFRQAAVDRLA